MTIKFDVKLVDSTIQVGGPSQTANSELSSILEKFVKAHQDIYSQIGNARTIEVVINETNPNDVHMTLNSGPQAKKKFCQINIRQDQASRLKGIVPEPTQLPLPSATTAAKVAGIATGLFALYYAPVVTGTALFSGAVLGLTSWCMRPSQSKKMDDPSDLSVDQLPPKADIKPAARPQVKLPRSYETRGVIGIINGGPPKKDSSDVTKQPFVLIMKDLLLSETMKAKCAANRAKYGAFLEVLTAYEQKKLTPEMLKGLLGTPQKDESNEQYLLRYVMTDPELLKAMQDVSTSAISGPLTEETTALYCAIASFKSGQNLAAAFETVPGIQSSVTKDGNTCFMNAAFQLIMNDPELLRALVETYTQELTRADLTSETQRNGYRAFLTAVDAYQAGNKDQIDLTPLRGLFYDAQRAYVQGDSFEVIQALLGPVNQANYPGLFFRQTIEKRYVQYQPSFWENWSGKKTARERVVKSSPNWQTERDILPPNRTKRDQPQLAYSFPITLETDEVDGQRLINRVFTDVARSDQANIDAAAGYFADADAQTRGELSLWTERSSRTIIDQAPQRFMIDLKRFQFSRTGVRSKITKEIRMPERVTVQGVNYRLKSIVIHNGGVGGGHYYAYIRKGEQWSIANDSTVTPTLDIQNGLSNGYLYWYERI
jgi:hypothetical protein